MALLDDIIEAATDDKALIGTLLRKCLVLEQQVKNEKFKAWLDSELDGYDRDREAEFPSYRVFTCVNKGFLIGLAVRMDEQPLSLHVMEERDRKLVEKVHLHQPAASYEGRPNKFTDAALPWPPGLTAKYQTKFFKDEDLVLNRAWQEVPGSILVALLEQVRTRVLRFALELKDALPADSAEPKQIPASAVEKSVINHIYGGNIVIASHAENVSQLAHTNIAVGDITSLKAALTALGITNDGIKQLEANIEADKIGNQPTIGPKIKTWLANVGTYMSKEGAKAGVDVAKRLATKWLLQHYGLDTD
jgi:hypothetical protein